MINLVTGGQMILKWWLTDNNLVVSDIKMSFCALRLGLQCTIITVHAMKTFFFLLGGGNQRL